jgi:hypothetical protein
LQLGAAALIDSVLIRLLPESAPLLLATSSIAQACSIDEAELPPLPIDVKVTREVENEL